MTAKTLPDLVTCSLGALAGHAGYTMYINRDRRPHLVGAMKAKISKWGNSLAVRLPKHLADALELVPGTDVEIAQDGNRLTIEAVPGQKIPHYRLEDLLAQIKPGQKPPPLEDWSAVEPPWPDDDWSDIAPTDEEWEAMRREAEVKLAKRRSGSA